MGQYYFLATALPPIQIGAPPDITFREFDVLINENLSSDDLRSFHVLRGYYDILNIRAFWKKLPFDSYGTLDEKELEEALLDRGRLPDYINDFLDRYTDTKERLDHFPELIATYFRVESKRAGGFVKQYLKFERDLRLVMVALRAKILGKDIIREMQFEDPSETIVAEILAQKDAPEYDPPSEYQPVKQIFEEFPDHPLELHQALLKYRYEVAEEMAGVEMFSLNAILSYMIRLIMVLKWLELDAQKGIQMVDEMIKERA